MTQGKSTPQKLDDALRFDPLAEAERVTGTSYKKDPATLALGFVMMQEHSAKKRAMLEQCDDTTNRSTSEEYLRIAREEGFREVLKVPFTAPESTVQECFYVLYHDVDGILLAFDTYHGGINGGKFYYNIKLEPKDPDWYRVVSSGTFRDFDGCRVWVGDHDCREALRHHIAQLRARGEFVKEWFEKPFLWLLHHGDKARPDNHKVINAERIALLPVEVQKAIAGKQ